MDLDERLQAEIDLFFDIHSDFLGMKIQKPEVRFCDEDMFMSLREAYEVYGTSFLHDKEKNQIVIEPERYNQHMIDHGSSVWVVNSFIYSIFESIVKKRKKNEKTFESEIVQRLFHEGALFYEVGRAAEIVGIKRDEEMLKKAGLYLSKIDIALLQKQHRRTAPKTYLTKNQFSYALEAINFLPIGTNPNAKHPHENLRKYLSWVEFICKRYDEAKEKKLVIDIKTKKLVPENRMGKLGYVYLSDYHVQATQVTMNEIFTFDYIGSIYWSKISKKLTYTQAMANSPRNIKELLELYNGENLEVLKRRAQLRLEEGQGTREATSSTEDKKDKKVRLV